MCETNTAELKHTDGSPFKCLRLFVILPSPQADYLGEKPPFVSSLPLLALKGQAVIALSTEW